MLCHSFNLNGKKENTLFLAHSEARAESVRLRDDFLSQFLHSTLGYSAALWGESAQKPGLLHKS